MSKHPKKPTPQQYHLKFDTSKANLECFMKKRSHSLLGDKTPLNTTDNKKLIQPSTSRKNSCTGRSSSKPQSISSQAKKKKLAPPSEQFHEVNFISSIIKNAMQEQFEDAKQVSQLLNKITLESSQKCSGSGNNKNSQNFHSNNNNGNNETSTMKQVDSKSSKQSKDSPPNDQLLKTIEIFAEPRVRITSDKDNEGRKTPQYARYFAEIRNQRGDRGGQFEGDAGHGHSHDHEQQHSDNYLHQPHHSQQQSLLKASSQQQQYWKQKAPIGHNVVNAPIKYREKTPTPLQQHKERMSTTITPQIYQQKKWAIHQQNQISPSSSFNQHQKCGNNFDIEFGKQAQWHNFSTQMGTEDASERSRRGSALDMYPSTKLQEYSSRQFFEMDNHKNNVAEDQDGDQEEEFPFLQQSQGEKKKTKDSKKSNNKNLPISRDRQQHSNRQQHNSRPSSTSALTTQQQLPFSSSSSIYYTSNNNSAAKMYHPTAHNQTQLQPPTSLRQRKSTPINQHQNQQYKIRLQQIYNDPRTTIMIRHIPNKYTQDILIEQLNVNNKHKYNFFYLPVDPYNMCNVGYAFINFIDTKFIEKFYLEFNERRWQRFNSEKICELAYARIQGTQALMGHFQGSNVMHARDRRMRPFVVGNGSQSTTGTMFTGEGGGNNSTSGYGKK